MLTEQRKDEIASKWLDSFRRLNEQYTIDVEKYKSDPDIVAVYSTKKSGGVAAYIIRKSRGKYSYRGKAGAGSGLQWDDIKRTVNVTRSSKKGTTLIYGTDVNDYKG